MDLISFIIMNVSELSAEQDKALDELSKVRDKLYKANYDLIKKKMDNIDLPHTQNIFDCASKFRDNSTKLKKAIAKRYRQINTLLLIVSGAVLFGVVGIGCALVYKMW